MANIQVTPAINALLDADDTDASKAALGQENCDLLEEIKNLIF
jgi:hypothetical protein